jgi:uncharacterized protein (TIGR02147 family)
MKKSIFEYDNYREFLRDTLEARKRSNPGFSIRNFARRSGFKAHSYVVRILQGKKDLSSDGIARVAHALKLNREEAAFFGSLVKLNQAKTSSDRQIFALEILSQRSYRKLHPLGESQYNYLSTWYYVVIRELVDLPEFEENYEWIARQVLPPITASQAKRAMDELIQVGLLERRPDGRLAQVTSLLSTPNEVTSSAVVQYHRSMLKLASEAIDRVARENRDITAQTIGISKQTARKIKEMLQDFRKQTMELVSQEQGAEVIYQLNFQLFPVSAIPPSTAPGATTETAEEPT